MPTSAGFLVEIDGSPLPPEVAAQLASAHVDDSLRLPDLFVLRFRDQDRSVLSAAKVKIGSTAKISVQTSDGQTPEALISGEVTALEAEFDSTGTFTVIRGYDQAHRLFRGRRTESYTQSTVSDVVTQVARRAGLKIGNLDSTSTVHPHLSQGGVTDWEFLDRLAREIGYEITVKDGKIDFRKPETAQAAPAPAGPADSNPLVLKMGADLLRFRSVITSAEQVGQVQVRGWDLAEKKALTANAPAATKTAVLPTIDPAKIAKTFGDPVYVASDTAYRSQAEVDAAAGALAEHIAGSFAEFEGVARGNPKLRANAPISIESIGAPFEGKYTITTSRHRYDPSTGYTTAFAVTGRQERSLFGLSSGPSAGGGRAAGPVVALVSDVRDPENTGRVKVTYPWLSDNYVSDWARTVQPGAGKDRGAMVVPEVGDEVLVVFEQGDFARPYVLGGLWNGKDTAPSIISDLVDSGSGAINRRSVVSRLGHRIDLLDKQGSADGITVATKDDKLTLQLDQANTKITVHSDGSILIEGKQGIVIDAGQQKLEFKAGEISMKANTGVKIDGGSGVEMKSSGAFKVESTTLALQGQASAELKASGVITIQGSLVKIN
jgi:phage protein D/phage baseplate assembly protein gpV